MKSTADEARTDIAFHLHVGLTKTGTKTLQKSIFRHHPELHYIGKSLFSGASRKPEADGVRQVLEPLLSKRRVTTDVDTLRSLAQQHLLQPAGDKRLLVSWEALGSLPHEEFRAMLERVLQVVGPLRLIMTLRNPLTRATSSYLQVLQSNFLRGHHSIPFGRTYIDFTKWLCLKGRNGRNNHLFDYGDSLRCAVTLLGRDNVGVFPLELLAADSAQYNAQLCAFMGIDPAEGLSLLAGTHRNPALTQAQFEFIRETNNSFLRRLAWLRSSRSARQSQLDNVADAQPESGPARIKLQAEHEAYIRHETAASNRWIEAEFGLGLERYGYPL